MAFQLESYEFRKEREAAWQDLERLVDRVERAGIRSLTPGDAARLPELYRGALSALSVARAISLDKNLVAYLESLSRRAYLTVYASRETVAGALGGFFRRRFPAAIWSMRSYLAVSILLLAAGAAAGYLLTIREPDRFYGFVPGGMAGERGPLSTREELLEVLTDRGDGALGMLLGFASFLFANNAKIGLLCFPLGFAAGVPVLLLLFVNGLILGAFAAIHASRGLSLEFWGWVLPHGVTELLAVAICGAAGLTVGHAIVFPGPHTRLENLVRAGREAAAVVAGTAALFLAAAVVEGFFRQLVQDTAVRYLMASATAGFWIWFLLVHARRQAGER